MNPNSILIVEDDKGVSTLLRKRLENAGYNTYQIYKGNDTINYALKNPDNLMLLDYYLPDMTCKNVIEELNKKKCKVNFIIMTAFGDEMLAVEMMKLGAIDYLAKGMEFIDLVPTAVEQAIKKIDSQRKLAEEQEELNERVCKLQKKLTSVKTLRGLLAICAYCKKIRDDMGYWNQIEIYIKEHSYADFTHGICPACQKKLYPD